MITADAKRPGTRQIASMYTRLAVVYDAWTWIFERKALHAALARADIANGEAILEVAVGSGYVFEELLRRNSSGRTVGTDLTEAMLRKTRRRAERVGAPFTLEQGDARTLRFEDASFDLVLSNNMLGLLPREDVARVVREMLRVLRPGGRLVLVAMARPPTRVPRWIYELGAMRLGGWSEVKLESLALDCGLEQVAREVVTQLGFPSEILFGVKPIA